MLNDIIRQNAHRVKHRLWLVSDLQQSIPERAEQCMTRATEDFLSLGMPVDAVCYLGDSVEGHDLQRIRIMTEMQLREFRRIGAPVYYVPGNHDYEYYAAHKEELGRLVMPFSERVAEDPQWHLQPAPDALSFEADFGEFAVVFLPDHAAPDGSWYTTHGVVHGDKDAYPYTYEDYRALCAHMEALGKPVFTMSHYNFPGGNREAPLLEQMLPLPKNLVMHFYGHAHIGDTAWAHENAHRKLAGIHNHALMQANISSLEEGRSTGTRSAVLMTYDDGSTAVFFRNHSLRRWEDAYFLQAK